MRYADANLPHRLAAAKRRILVALGEHPAGLPVADLVRAAELDLAVASAALDGLWIDRRVAVVGARIALPDRLPAAA